MAWGKPTPHGVLGDNDENERREGDDENVMKSSIVSLIEKNDPTVRAITIFRGRNFTGARETTAVGLALEKNQFVKEFYSSGHEMTRETAEILGRSFSKMKSSLESICVGDERFGGGGGRGNNDDGGQKDDDADGDEDAFEVFLSYAKELDGLRKWDLENKGLTKKSLGKLSDAFQSEKFIRLEELILNRNESLSDRSRSSDDTSATTTNKSPTAMERLFQSGAIRQRVKTLEISDISLGEASISALAEELKGKCSLEVFKFTNGRLECFRLKELDDDDGVEEKKNESETDDTAADESEKKEKDKKKKEERDKATTAMMNELGEGFVNNKSLKRVTLDGTKVGAYELLKGISRAKRTNKSEKSNVVEISLANCALNDDNSKTNAVVGFLLSDFAESVEIVNLNGNALGDWKVAQLAGAIQGGFCQNMLEIDIGGNDLSDATILKRLLFGKTKIKRLSCFENVNLLKSKENVGKLFEDAEILSAGSSPCEYLDVGACGMELEELTLFAESIRKHKSAFVNLKTLVLGGNPGACALGDAFENELKLLKESMSSLDIAWKANDSGDIDKFK
jgi:hypothetical protein